MYIRMPPSNITLLRFGLDSFIYLHGINRIENQSKSWPVPDSKTKRHGKRHDIGGGVKKRGGLGRVT